MEEAEGNVREHIEAQRRHYGGGTDAQPVKRKPKKPPRTERDLGVWRDGLGGGRHIQYLVWEKMQFECQGTGICTITAPQIAKKLHVPMWAVEEAIKWLTEHRIRKTLYTEAVVTKDGKV